MNKTVEKVIEDTILWFGKYKDETVKYVLDTDPNYLGWCIENKILSIDEETDDFLLSLKHEQDLISEAIMESMHGDWGCRK